MDGWPKGGIEVSIDRGEFENLLEIYRSWINKRTSNLVKLGIVLDQAYLALSAGQRARFCGILISEGMVDEDIAGVLASSRGSLKRLTYVGINKGTAAGS